MANYPTPEITDQEYLEAQKRVKKIRNFYKNLASWAASSVFMVALDLFLSGGITWSKFPVFFWGISLVFDFFQVLRLQRLDKEWEKKQLKKLIGRDHPLPQQKSEPDQPAQEPLEDYSEELLNQQDREMEKLSDYRKLQRPWKDEDLV